MRVLREAGCARLTRHRVRGVLAARSPDRRAIPTYDRPRHVAIDGGVGAGSYRWVGDFEAGPDGTWMTGRMDWRPPRRWRRLGPVLQRILQWNADRSFRRMARVLEGTGASWLRR